MNTTEQEVVTVKITAAMRREASEYYALCKQASDLGIPVALDDPASPKTVQELRDMIEECEPWEAPMMSTYEV